MLCPQDGGVYFKRTREEPKTTHCNQSVCNFPKPLKDTKELLGGTQMFPLINSHCLFSVFRCTFSARIQRLPSTLRAASRLACNVGHSLVKPICVSVLCSIWCSLIVKRFFKFVNIKTVVYHILVILIKTILTHSNEDVFCCCDVCSAELALCCHCFSFVTFNMQPC